MLGLGGTFSPLLRASESPIAMACFRLVTFLPLRPLFNLPLCISCISVLTCFPAFGLYFRPDLFFEEDFFEELFLAEDFFDEDFFEEVRFDTDFFEGVLRLALFFLEDFFADVFRPDFLLAFFAAIVKPPVKLEHRCTNFVASQAANRPCNPILRLKAYCFVSACGDA